MRYQLDASEPLKKQLWKQTVIAKISNQAAVLKMLGKEYESLLHIADSVLSGDTENREGQAAALYWKILFEDSGKFKRGREEDPPNNLLNYGYAVLRAIVARSLVASGMIPAMGIHHRNKYNAFCLADDVMEPYRPYVDKLVISISEELNYQIPDNITTDIKAKLLQIPVMDVIINDNSSPLMIATQHTTASLMRCFEGEGKKISYPEMV